MSRGDYLKRNWRRERRYFRNLWLWERVQAGEDFEYIVIYPDKEAAQEDFNQIKAFFERMEKI